jgi:dihydrofolate reductase
MRRIINSTYISLDGVVEQPRRWPTIERPNDERSYTIQNDLLQVCDAVLGCRTYEGFAPVWPTRTSDPVSDRMNAMPKYVVSTTLTDPDWANTVIATDVPEAITKLKAQAGKHIVQYGFGAVSTLLMQHGLLERAAALDPSAVRQQRHGRGRLDPEKPTDAVRAHRLDGPAQGHGDPQLPRRLTTPQHCALKGAKYGEDSQLDLHQP